MAFGLRASCPGTSGAPCLPLGTGKWMPPPLFLVMMLGSSLTLDEIAQRHNTFLPARELQLDLGAGDGLQVLADGGQRQRCPGLAVDGDDDVAGVEARLGRGTVLDHVDDCVAVRTAFDPHARPVESIRLAEVGVLLEIQRRARKIERDVELAQDTLPDAAGDIPWRRNGPGLGRQRNDGLADFNRTQLHSVRAGEPRAEATGLTS